MRGCLFIFLLLFLTNAQGAECRILFAANPLKNLLGLTPSELSTHHLSQLSLQQNIKALTEISANRPVDLKLYKEILQKCLKAEQGALVNWNKICQMTLGKDPTTYDIAKDILAEEIEHESWFLELIYGRPSGHMRRKHSGERPHTRKHSRALDMA